MLMKILLWVYMILSAFPFIPFLIIWTVVYLRNNDKKEALKWAFDGSVPFLIVSVSAMYDHVVGTQFNGFYIILLFLLLLLGFFGNIQNRIRGQIHLLKLFRAVWRIVFMVLAPAYVLLVIIGIIQELVS